MGNVDSKDIPQYGNDQKDFARDASSSKKLKLDPIHFSVETSKVSSIEEQDKDNSSPDKTEDIPDPVSAAAKELSEVITHMTGLLHEGIFQVRGLIKPAIFGSLPWAYVMCNWAQILIYGRH